MLNLAEYRQRPALLADWLPWAGLVAPGVVLNKDGSFQRTFQFRGPDGQCDTGRADCHVGAAEQRASPYRVWLGLLYRGRADAGIELSAILLSRTTVLAGG